MEAALGALRDSVLAAARDRRRLRIRGAGSKDFLGGSPDGTTLDVRPLAGVVAYEPDELVLTARAGTPLAELETLLAGHGQWLAFEPPLFGGEATLGGAVAAGLAGPARATAGAVRDFVLGVRLMNGRGEVLSFGGRVMKNVAGFDVAWLVGGSLGILGVITEVSIKVLPRPAVTATLAFEMGAAQAVEAFNRWARRPLPLAATSWYDGVAHVRLAGVDAAVEAACAALGGRRLGADDAAHWWEGLRHHRHPFLAPRTRLWRVCVPSTAAPIGVDGPLLIEWAGALRWLRTDAAPAEVRDAARRAGGTAACWHDRAAGPTFEPLAPAALAIHRRLKAAFDPDGIFNPGRLVPGL
jgi:glycolate oxidase FAD binding subunit